MHRSLIALALLLLAPVATAQVYKWTDAHGTTHYSETPPAAGTNFKKVKANGSAESLGAPAPASSSASTSGNTAPSSDQPLANTPENRGKMCDSLKANLAALQGSAPVVMQQDGKTVVLDGDQRKLQANVAQSQYQAYCQAK
ncbi:MAG TPA: DUF4124 domain-containing protein [Rhodanobacter sp.]